MMPDARVLLTLEALVEQNKRIIAMLEAKTAAASVAKRYRVKEVAEILGLSRQQVAKIFEKRPGVHVLGNVNNKGQTRRYATLLIPEPVLQAYLAESSRGR